MNNIYESEAERENHFIKWCCYEVKHAKTRADVYRIKCIGCNHVPKRFDYIFESCIPEELR